MHSFVHLRGHSDYSLGLGIAKVKELVDRCAKEGMPAICLADHGNLFGSLEFSQHCLKRGIQPIIGAILRIDINTTTSKVYKEFEEILIIAKTEEGYKNLLYLVSTSFLTNDFFYPPHITLELLKEYSKGLIVLYRPAKRDFGELYLNKDHQIIRTLQEIIAEDFYLEIDRTVGYYDAKFESAVLEIAFNRDIPIVATNDIYFLNVEESKASDVLKCIYQGILLEEMGEQRNNLDNYFRSQEEMNELFWDLPEAIENTINIAKKCVVYCTNKKPRWPSFVLEGEESRTEEEILTEESRQGLEKRLQAVKYDVKRDEYYQRLEFELDIIKKMGFSGYFLIVSDLIKWSKSQRIPVGPGRGSGAGSLVAWAIEITNVDPLAFGLLFERFLNPYRISMPDFDIDFCQNRRDEVIEYVKGRYGKEKVASIITFGTFQPRAALRDVGRALNIPLVEVDRICKMVPINPANPVTLQEAIDLDIGLQQRSKNDPLIGKLLAISLQLEGVNRHVSTHAAGVVIAPKPLIEFIPLYCDKNSAMPVVQYSLKYIEDAGLVKFDFLGLKTLTVIDDTCQLVLSNRGVNIDIDDIPLDDEMTYKLLTEGKTTAIFQFEGVGMREAMKKLKPDKIEDLIALGSLYRPGPMDNMYTYINRKHGLEQAAYLHPKLEEILKETYGVIVYQEQVIMIAQHLAGYTTGEADLLRRAMGKKIKDEMQASRNTFIQGAVHNGISEELAEEIFNLIDKFASYGFNKSHATAYAIVAYQTAYLKAHYTLEFFVTAINSELNDTEKLNLLVVDAKNHGIKILPPDINHSKTFFCIEDGGIRFGLGAIKNVSVKAIEEIVKIREDKGSFSSIDDFIKSNIVDIINKRMLENLSKAGAFDCLERNRRKICDNVPYIIRWMENEKESTRKTQGSLFDDLYCEELAISLPETPMWSFQEELLKEFEAVGFYIGIHPIEEYLVRLTKIGVVMGSDLIMMASEKSIKVSIAGAITSKRIKSSNRGRYAFLQLSDHTGITDISIFDEKLLVQYESQNLLQIGTKILAKVEVRRDESGLRITVENMEFLDEAMSKVKVLYTVAIRDLEDIEKLKSCICEDEEVGMPMRVVVRFDDGYDVYLKSIKPILVDPSQLQSLRRLGVIEVLSEE
ncbi:DNA polymerase III subunit alpha [Rickettsiales endosymbiont of Peranema trichophorum]|uniref:DNA polymerase III subunit alpha n=1 Tax=Rickettsiales endosymbiont of Peranema trichophorum TaxID=2486577 RepID=UPI001022BD8B|nr:DNA polymerase III subunit alpha [Rickettsiales endosymbiont of Peranema trichophorum]RZI47162.1 DNA polymerase III subunit alpha [Rickettsiales endosymbiont of Peranema trichophorum]